MTQNIQFAAIMIAAGIGIPILAALNASLGARVGSPVAAATILFLVAFCSVAVVLFLTGDQSLIRTTLHQPKHLFFAGVLVAFYVLSITYVAPKFGVGNAVFFVLMGQLISTAAIDHFGLFGARQIPLSTLRAAGIAVMAAGLFLTQIA